MNPENSLRTFAADISEMVESARQVKGEKFVAIAAAIFECVQVANTLSKMGAMSSEPSIKSSVEATRYVALSASARISSVLDDKDADEAIQLVRRMLQRRDAVEAALAAAASRADGGAA